MDFYTATSEKAAAFTAAEKGIFAYVVKHMPLVKKMSVRELAAACGASTASLLRFVKKLGYAGYVDFVFSVQEAEQSARRVTAPILPADLTDRDSYLKALIESVRHVTDEKRARFSRLLEAAPAVYLLADGPSGDVARYLRRQLMAAGRDALVPAHAYEWEFVYRRAKREDLLLALSYSGENRDLIRRIERVLVAAAPALVSVTRAENNVIQNMSDLNFPMFTAPLERDGQDLTSRCEMIAILETLLRPHLMGNID